MSEESVILSNDSGQIKFQNRPSFVFLSRRCFSVCDVRNPGSKPLVELNLSDITGSRLEKDKPDKKTRIECYKLTVFAYPVKIAASCCGEIDSAADKVRIRKVITLKFCTSRATAENWLHAINSLCRHEQLLQRADTDIEAGIDAAVDIDATTSTIADANAVVSSSGELSMFLAPEPRHYMVIVNPVGGQRLGLKIWQRIVQPMLQEAGIEVHLLITEYADHAKDVVTETDLSIFYAVVCIGGDGMVYEVINGLMAGASTTSNTDPDAYTTTNTAGPDTTTSNATASASANAPTADAASLPNYVAAMDRLQQVNLVHIPGGTGNGLAKSALFASKEAYTPMNAAFVAIKGRSHPLDISVIYTSSAADTRSGSGSQVTASDIEATSSLVQETRDAATAAASSDADASFSETEQQQQQQQQHLSFLSCEWGLVADVDILSENMRCLGELRMTLAGLYFIMKRRYYAGRLRMRLAVDNNSNGSSNLRNNNDQSNSNSNNDGRVTAHSVAINPIAESRQPSISSTSTGTAADGAEGDGWLTIEGNFLMVWVVQTSHAAGSMHSGPGVLMNDGVFTVYVVQKITRSALLGLLLALDNGDHIHHPDVHTYKCLEYSLEPLTEKGIIAVDGEVVPYGPIHATMLPGAARILTL